MQKRNSTLLRRLIYSALLTSAWLTPALAGDLDRSIKFEVAAQPLDKALLELSQQADFQMVLPMGAIPERNAPRLAGQMTIKEALQRLLQGTDLSYKQIGERTLTVVVGSEHSTSGGQGASGAERTSLGDEIIESVNVFGSLADQLSIGSKSGQSLRETPKSVTVVTRERIEAQNLSSLMETLNQTTGVTVQSYSNGGTDSFFFSRGYRVNTLQIDGGAPAFTGGFGMFLVPDMASYDHIEMLRGVDGMYTGAGGPGGVINLVRKKASDAFGLKVNLSAGRWDNYRSEVDVTGALTDSGRVRGRLVGAYEDKGYFVDRAKTEKIVGYGTLEVDITDSTLLAVGASYEDRDESAYSNNGLPRYTDGRDLNLPRSTNLSADWSHWFFETKEVFARLEQQYGRDGVVKLNLTHIEQDSESRSMFTRVSINPVTRTGATARATGGDFTSEQNLVDLSASGTFELFGRSHRYTVGTDYAKIDGGGQRNYTMPGYTFATAQPLDVFNFNQSLYAEPTPLLSGLYPVNERDQNGFYATVGLQLAEPLRLTLGGRYSEFRYRQEFRSVSAAGVVGTPSRTRYDDTAFIPSVAVTYDFANDWSAYASYSETFEVQANLLQGPLPGTPLDPITGTGFEVGVKGELNGRINLAAALYRVERNGQGLQDPAYALLSPGADGSYCCYIKQANVISQGVDAEISGTLLPGWQLFAGYTFNSNRSEDDPTDGYSSGKYFLNLTPKHMFKMWTTWQLPGDLARWTVNGGVVAQTESYITGTALESATSTTLVPYKFAQGSYALWNASVQFRIDDHWTVALYGENLTDKTYYQVLGTTDRENVYGMPRSYVLKMMARW